MWTGDWIFFAVLTKWPTPPSPLLSLDLTSFFIWPRSLLLLCLQGMTMHLNHWEQTTIQTIHWQINPTTQGCQSQWPVKTNQQLNLKLRLSNLSCLNWSAVQWPEWPEETFPWYRSRPSGSWPNPGERPSHILTLTIAVSHPGCFDSVHFPCWFHLDTAYQRNVCTWS